MNHCIKFQDPYSQWCWCNNTSDICKAAKLVSFSNRYSNVQSTPWYRTIVCWLQFMMVYQGCKYTEILYRIFVCRLSWLLSKCGIILGGTISGFNCSMVKYSLLGWGPQQWKYVCLLQLATGRQTYGHGTINYLSLTRLIRVK
jgi:hypothetical protein